MGLRALFKNHSTIRLVAETNCIDDLYHLVALHKPDVILIDLLLDNGFGIDHISRLINASPQSKVLAFSHHNNECTGNPPKN